DSVAAAVGRSSEHSSLRGLFGCLECGGLDAALEYLDTSRLQIFQSGVETAALHKSIPDAGQYRPPVRGMQSDLIATVEMNATATRRDWFVAGMPVAEIAQAGVGPSSSRLLDRPAALEPARHQPAH